MLWWDYERTSTYFQGTCWYFRKIAIAQVMCTFRVFLKLFGFHAAWQHFRYFSRHRVSSLINWTLFGLHLDKCFNRAIPWSNTAHYVHNLDWLDYLSQIWKERKLTVTFLLYVRHFLLFLAIDTVWRNFPWIRLFIGSWDVRVARSRWLADIV